VGRETTPDGIVIGGLCLMLAINVVDLLPNSNLTSLTFLAAGSVATALGARSASRLTARPPTSRRQVLIAKPMASQQVGS
jgi:hypothetical protein